MGELAGATCSRIRSLTKCDRYQKTGQFEILAVASSGIPSLPLMSSAIEYLGHGEPKRPREECAEEAFQTAV
jgi:hypothetical protein